MNRIPTAGGDNLSGSRFTVRAKTPKSARAAAPGAAAVHCRSYSWKNTTGLVIALDSPELNLQPYTDSRRFSSLPTTTGFAPYERTDEFGCGSPSTLAG